MSGPSSDGKEGALPRPTTGGVLARAGTVYGADFPVLFGIALAGALAGVAVGRLLDGVPLLPWLALAFVGSLFNACIIRRLDAGHPPAGESRFLSRILVYTLGVIAIEVALGVSLILGGIVGALLALLVHALGSLVGLPSPVLTALGVFVFLLIPALPLVAISMGGVFVGFTSVLDGKNAVDTVRESFFLVGRHWKLVGAVVTVTYGVLFLIAIVGGGVEFFYTFHHFVAHDLAPVSPRAAEEARRLLGVWWGRLPRSPTPPLWWNWLAAPLLAALPLPWVLAASHVIYAADRDRRNATGPES
jgi:hypothetical protein